jgi:hypothetical protein
MRDSVRDRNLRLKAARVITWMMRGVTLQLTYTKHGSDFRLSDGARVPPEVALAVVNDTRIRSDDKGLFVGTPQSWRYSENP